MTRRRDIEKHHRSLNEIRDIMNAMKNLSYMESRKISGFLDAQSAVVKHIETVAVDFLSFYPDVLTEASNTSVEVYLLIGAERGFCGDFNHRLLRHFKDTQKPDDANDLRIITVGQKFATLMQNEEQPTIFIDGASVAEEVDKVLTQIADQLTVIQTQYGSLNLYVLYHGNDQQIINQQLLPPFQNLLHHQTQETNPPELNLEPKKFLLELSYHYLFAVLNEILYTSLMAESRQRLTALEGSVQHIEEQSEELQRQSNVLRQEEIIEEIEVILLSAVSLD